MAIGLLPILLVLTSCDSKPDVQLRPRFDVTLPGDFQYEDRSHVKAALVADTHALVVEAGSPELRRLIGLSPDTGKQLWTIDLNEHYAFRHKRATRQSLMGVEWHRGAFDFLVRDDDKLLCMRWSPGKGKARTRRLGDYSVERACNQEYMPIKDGVALIPTMYRPQLVDLARGSPTVQLEAVHDECAPTYVAFSQDGKFASWTCAQAKVWETNSGKLVNATYVPPMDVIKGWKPARRYYPSACAISPNDELFAVGTVHGDLLIFDLKTAKLLGSASLLENPEKGSAEVGFLHFLPGSRYLVVYEPLSVFDCKEMCWAEVAGLDELRKTMDCASLLDMRNSTIFIVDRSGDRARAYEFAVSTTRSK